MSLRIGINGGTFDPIHFGHLRPALEVLEACQLDQMRFIPCRQPVHRDCPQVSAQDRLEMVRRAIAPVPEFILDPREMERDGPSYMVDTLASLHADFPKATLVLMMGQDAFAAFDRWHQWREILQRAAVVVTQRPEAPGSVPDPLRAYLFEGPLDQLTAGQVGFLAVTQLAISATDIRRRLQAGKRVNYLLPQTVLDYIEHKGLYGRDSSERSSS